MPPTTSYFPLCPISCCSKSPKKKLTKGNEISIRINNKETLTVPQRTNNSTNKSAEIKSKKIVYSRPSSEYQNTLKQITAIDIDGDEVFTTARTHGPADRKHLSMKDLMHSVRIEEGLTARSTHSTSSVNPRCSLPTIPEQPHLLNAAELNSYNAEVDGSIEKLHLDTNQAPIEENSKKKRKAAVFNNHGDISARSIASSVSMRIGSDSSFDEPPSFQLSTPAPTLSAVQRYIISSPQVVIALASVAYSWIVSFFHMFGKSN